MEVRLWHSTEGKTTVCCSCGFYSTVRTDRHASNHSHLGFIIHTEVRVTW